MSNISDNVQSVKSTATDFILKHEIVQLEACLKNAAVKVLNIYRAQSRTTKLSSSQLATASRYPSASLTRSLALQIEKYDSFCDVIELELAKSIAVIRRDIAKEQARQLRASRTDLQIEETQTVPSQGADLKENTAISPSISEQFTLPHLPFGVQMGMGLAGPLNPSQARRPSTISLSSLRGPRQGAPFPLKLDLSATALRMDDTMIPGLYSPVTLAPRTARPPQSAVESDIIHSYTTADVGLSESDAIPGLDAIPIDMHNGNGTLSLGAAAGDSSQLPLTLDLADTGDMESLFGDVLSAVDTAAPELPSILSHNEPGVMEGAVDTEALFTPKETSSGPVAGPIEESGRVLDAEDTFGQSSTALSQEGQLSLDDASRSAFQTSLGNDFDLVLDDLPGFSQSFLHDFAGEPGLEGDGMDIVRQLFDSGMPPTGQNDTDRE